MRESEHDVQIDDKLLELVSGNARSAASRKGLYITFGVIVIVLVLFAYVSRSVGIETRKLESEAQAAMTQSVSRQVERRLLTFADRLEQLPQERNEGLLCADAADLFDHYVEFAELSLVSAEGLVLQTCVTPHALDSSPHALAQFVRTGTLETLERAHRLKTSVFSSPYTRSKNGVLFSNLVMPMGDGGFYVARISITSMLRHITENLSSRYKFSLLVEGKELSAVSDVSSAAQTEDMTPSDNIRITSPLTPLPESVRLLTVNTRMDSVYGYTKLVLGIMLFGGLLILSMLGVLIYQYRQLKTEEALRARVIVQQAMSQSILDGIMVTDRLGKILYTNRAFNTLFRDEAGDVLGMTPPYAFARREKSIFNFENYLQKDGKGEKDEKGDMGDIVRAEFTALRHDGTNFICAAEILPLKALYPGQGQPGWLVTLRDITQQKKSRQALAIAHERTIRVLESMDSAVSVAAVNSEGICELLYANARYIEVFGHSAAAHERLMQLVKNQGPVAQSGTVYDEVTRRWFFIGERSLPWMGGRQAELLTIQDVTVKKEHEELLEQQMKNAEQVSRLMTMGELASSLAHELNQPLAAVQNYASATLTMLKAGKLTAAGVETGLNKIINQTQRAAQIIRRIRGFAKRGDVARVQTRVSRIVDETLELALMQAKKYAMTIEVDVHDGDEVLVCDPVLIEQVLINLLKNAMEASLSGNSRTVYFTVRREKKTICFYVADHGCGIDAESAKRVFDPFFSTKPTGMGIGLNICRSIVENHHGRLTFEPNAGGGTIFKLSLSAAAPAEGDSTQQSGQASSSQTTSIQTNKPST